MGLHPVSVYQYLWMDIAFVFKHSYYTSLCFLKYWAPYPTTSSGYHNQVNQVIYSQGFSSQKSHCLAKTSRLRRQKQERKSVARRASPDAPRSFSLLEWAGNTFGDF